MSTTSPRERAPGTAPTVRKSTPVGIRATALNQLVLPLAESAPFPGAALAASPGETIRQLTAVPTRMPPVLPDAAFRAVSETAKAPTVQWIQPYRPAGLVFEDLGRRVAALTTGLALVKIPFYDLVRQLPPHPGFIPEPVPQVCANAASALPFTRSAYGPILKSLAHLRAGGPAADVLPRLLASLTAVIPEDLRHAIVAELEAAYAAYMKGEAAPMQSFVRRHLRLKDRLDDYCQALALALIENAWCRETDLRDPDAVRKVLLRHARAGCDLEVDHQVGLCRIAYLGDTDWPAAAPSPESAALARVVAWHDQFDNRHVRYAASRLDSQEKAVARAWAENPPIAWTQIPQLIAAEPGEGERVRRKIKRLGAESSRRMRQVRREAW